MEDVFSGFDQDGTQYTVIDGFKYEVVGEALAIRRGEDGENNGKIFYEKQSVYWYIEDCIGNCDEDPSDYDIDSIFDDAFACLYDFDTRAHCYIMRVDTNLFWQICVENIND